MMGQKACGTAAVVFWLFYSEIDELEHVERCVGVEPSGSIVEHALAQHDGGG
jgi:hypothetical protein